MSVLKYYNGSSWESLSVGGVDAATMAGFDVADLAPIPATTQSGTTYTLDLS